MQEAFAEFGLAHGLLEVERPTLTARSPFTGPTLFTFHTHTSAPFALGPYSGSLYFDKESNSLALPFPASDSHRKCIPDPFRWHHLFPIERRESNCVTKGRYESLTLRASFDAASYLKSIESLNDGTLEHYCQFLYILLPRLTVATLIPVSPFIYMLNIPLALSKKSKAHLTGLLSLFPIVVSSKGAVHAPPNLAFLPVSVNGEPTDGASETIPKGKGRPQRSTQRRA